jgi:hypothetical protein
MSLKTDIQDLKRQLGSINIPRCMALFKHDPPVNEVLFPLGDAPLCNVNPSGPDVCLACHRVKAGRKMIAEARTRYEGPDEKEANEGISSRCYLTVTRNRSGEVLGCNGCTQAGRDESTQYEDLPDCSTCPITRRYITDMVILSEGADLTLEGINP